MVELYYEVTIGCNPRRAALGLRRADGRDARHAGPQQLAETAAAGRNLGAGLAAGADGAGGWPTMSLSLSAHLQH